MVMAQNSHVVFDHPYEDWPFCLRRLAFVKVGHLISTAFLLSNRMKRIRYTYAFSL